MLCLQRQLEYENLLDILLFLSYIGHNEDYARIYTIRNMNELYIFNIKENRDYIKL